MEQKNELPEIHSLLSKTYRAMLLQGCDDPRVLKEIREFLKDNDVKVKLTDQSVPDSAPISLDLEEELFKLVSND